MHDTVRGLLDRLWRVARADRLAKVFHATKTVREAVENDVGDGGWPICSCQRASGKWEVRRVERVW